jgi:hypothetical protein
MFDYEKAHRDLIEPRMKKLGPKALDLIERVKIESAELRQNLESINFDLPWPESDLKEKFECLSDVELADMARISYFYGHWNKMPLDHGWTWKVSNYCDQILRFRLGLEEMSIEVPRIFYEVHEGMLRICIYGKDIWTWDEVGPASVKNFEILRLHHLDKEIKASKDISNIIKNFGAIISKLRGCLQQTEISQLFIDLSNEQTQRNKLS